MGKTRRDSSLVTLLTNRETLRNGYYSEEQITENVLTRGQSVIRSSLRDEKERSFLFSRLDLLNRTDPGEAVRNVEYMM